MDAEIPVRLTGSKLRQQIWFKKESVNPTEQSVLFHEFMCEVQVESESAREHKRSGRYMQFNLAVAHGTLASLVADAHACGIVSAPVFL